MLVLSYICSALIRQHLAMQPILVKYFNICSASREGVTHMPLLYIVEVKFMPRYTQVLQPECYSYFSLSVMNYNTLSKKTTFLSLDQSWKVKCEFHWCNCHTVCQYF